MSGNVVPEQQHEGLQEGAEVIVVIYGCVLVEINVTEHLRTRARTHTHTDTDTDTHTHTHTQLHKVDKWSQSLSM